MAYSHFDIHKILLSCYFYCIIHPRNHAKLCARRVVFPYMPVHCKTYKCRMSRKYGVLCCGTGVELCFEFEPQPVLTLTGLHKHHCSCLCSHSSSLPRTWCFPTHNVQFFPPSGDEGLTGIVSSRVQQKWIWLQRLHCKDSHVMATWNVASNSMNMAELHNCWYWCSSVRTNGISSVLKFFGTITWYHFVV